jgi:hypothetical protein
LWYFQSVVGTVERSSNNFLAYRLGSIFFRHQTCKLFFLSVLTWCFSLLLLYADSGKFESSVHHTVFELLSDLLLKFFQFFLNLWVDVPRFLQISTSKTNGVSTWWARSLSLHSVPYLAKVWLPINVFSDHRLRWHLILVLVVIFRGQQRTEEASMVLNVDWTEGMANCDASIICIVMVLPWMNTWSKLGRVINLSRGFTPVTLFSSSLCANHLILLVTFYLLCG